MKTITLYHSGFAEIRNPDIHYGRKNADFGQGFYLTDDEQFALRWAREKNGSDTIINRYVLDPSNLKLQIFERNEAWFDYIDQNRHRQPDRYLEADVIIGPIANDTIFNTMGIITSGMLSREESLRLLMIGPAYQQIVIKTEKAVSQLQFESARILNPEELQQYRETVQKEEHAFMQEFGTVLQNMQ